MVFAENIKDYFKDGAYKDLMDFEDDIANIAYSHDFDHRFSSALIA
jgi:hypothetical protein